MKDEIESALFAFSQEIHGELSDAILEEINFLVPGTLSPHFVKCASEVLARRVKIEMFDKVRDREWMESFLRTLKDEQH
ncbi:MAG: hypothetical protein AAGB31_11780 [Bdellovibrio sp.]